MSTSATFEDLSEFQDAVASVRNDATEDVYVIVGHLNNDPAKIGVVKVGQNVEELADNVDSTQVMYILARYESTFDMSKTVKFVYFRWFHQLYKKYHDEVYPAKLVFVSFFDNQRSKGYMVPLLEELGFKPLRFVFDLTRPDLSKLDKLFGMLATGTSDFDDEIAELEAAIKNNGLSKAFNQLTV